ncbi:D-alanine--D-alanine ligase family protein [Streptococcus pluranimalium]|uniref:D-alanine--D-alanine ligase family protein n=1 Tax=Streptococcus pluranimalium TaxID=82348 RepID=UPI003F68F116
MKIVVLAGGLSDERDVSMSSGSKIATALISKGHKVLLMDLYLGFPDSENFDTAYTNHGKKHYYYSIPRTEPDLDKIILENNGRTIEIGHNVVNICKSSDIVFLGLHGGIGENGKLQAFFDLHEIKYTGSNFKSSLLAMDKLTSKKLMLKDEILTPKWTIYKKGSQAELSVPAVVKPNDNGSSIGVKIVETNDDLQKSLAFASKYSKEVLVEEKIIGREFSVGILNEQPLPIIELIPKSGFYDYENKYQKGATEEVVPANVEDYLRNKMQQIALKVNHLLGLEIYARIDFIVDESNNIYCIEANSLPGMTPTSLLPQEAEAFGIKYEDLCEQIVELSLKKFH